MKALITGASSGIGREIAKEFARKEYDIILISRNMEALKEYKEELIREFNVDITCDSFDLNSKENCMELFEKYSDIDVLVNNAGFGDFGYFDKTSLEKDLTMIDTNIIAVHILTKLYLKKFKNRNRGRILNVASIAGFFPGPLMATYYSTKSYVVKLSESIRAELKATKSNVKISILCPGPVKTNFNNVANVKFDLKSLSSEYVAKYAVNNFLRGKFYIVPGFFVRCGRILSRLVPTSLVASIVYKTQKRKEG